MAIQQIVFQGKEYLLIGETDGAIATREQYANGFCPYAHLYPDGIIRRKSSIIGVKSDIEFKGPAQDVFVADGAMDQVMTHPSWRFSEDN